MSKEALARFGCVARILAVAFFYIAISFVFALFAQGYWYIELLISFFFLCSIARVVTLGDWRLRRDIIGMAGQKPKTHREMLSYLRHHTLSLWELITFLAFLLILPIDFGICVIGGKLFGGVSFYLLRRLLSLLTAAPFVILACYIGRRSAMFHLYTLKVEDRRDVGAVLLHLASYFGYAALYFAGSYVAAYVIVTVAAAVMMVVLLPSILGAIAAILLFILLRRLFRVVRARHRLARRVADICKSHGYAYTKPRALYRSAFLRFEGFHFSVTVGKDTYDCRIHSEIRRMQNIVFGDDGYLTSLAAPKGGLFALLVPMPRTGYGWHSGAGVAAALSGQEDPAAVFSSPYAVRKPYSFESENRKVLIVTPAVQRWYIAGGGMKSIDVGAWAFGYKIYNADSFLALLEREALSRDYAAK